MDKNVSTKSINFIKKTKCMETIFFSSKNEAVQYLSDLIGRSIRCANSDVDNENLFNRESKIKSKI